MAGSVSTPRAIRTIGPAARKVKERTSIADIDFTRPVESRVNTDFFESLGNEPCDYS